jgi:PAS domain S-box-containing protein
VASVGRPLSGSGEERNDPSRTTRHLLAIGVGLAVVVAGILLPMYARKGLLEASSRVERSHEALSSIEVVSGLLTEAETALGPRGGDAPGPAVVRAERALAAAHEELPRLSRLIETDPVQTARCNALGRLLATIRTGLSASGRGAAPLEIVLARSALHAMSERERRLLSGRTEEASSLSFRLDVAVSLRGLLSVVLLGISLLWLWRESRDRHGAELLAASILDTVPSGIISIDASGKVVKVNRAVEAMFGYEPGEIVGRNVSMLMPPPSREEHDGYVARYLSTREPRVIGLGRQVTGLHKDGRLLPLHLAVGELTVGGRSAFTGVLADVSDRLRAEDALADSLARLQGILDAATEVAIIATDTNGIVTLFNRGAERMLGYEASELVGRESPERFHLRTELADRGRAISSELGRPVRGFEVLVARARRGQPEEREWSYVRKDGSTFPVMLAVTPLLAGGAGPSGFLGVARDITAQKTAERLKSEFISTVSHELRTPLTSIRGSLGLLAAGRAGELPTRAVPLVEIAHRNAERLVLIVNDILDVEKMEAGEMRFAMEPLDAGQLVEQAIAANQAYALHLGVRLESRAAPDRVRVRGDAGRLIQVLTNLLSNAAKYSPDGAAVEVTTAATHDRVTIEVRDHGPGIPVEFQPRLFQKFGQADGTDSKRRGGTGLGLAIARAIVEAHDGRLGFETAPGWGTAFRVELPRHRDNSGLTVTGIPGRRVLVCEGDPEVAALLSRVLRQDGVATQIASTTEEARDFLAKGRYSAMTLDILLPGEGGIELFKWIRSRPGTARLPVLVVSGFDSSERATLESGTGSIVAWIEKPIAEEKLLAAVRGALMGSAGRRPRVLHVEDDADVATLVRTMLGDVVDVIEARTLAGASELLLHQDFDLVVLDVALPDGSGLELLSAGGARVRPAPVIVFSAVDVDSSIQSQTLAVLVKGGTTNEQLVEKIVESLGPLIDTRVPGARPPGQEGAS